MQSIWKGSISFGLVSIPVQLFTATEEHGIAFHQVHEADGGRIRYRRVCTVDGEEVTYDEIAKGYELASGEVVVLTDADFAELPLPTGRAINVLSFVEAGTIDPVRMSRCYYCDPIGPDPKPYRLLCEALDRTGKVAVVKVALRGRESVALLRPHDQVLLLQLLLWPDEVRKPRFPFLGDDMPLPPQELRMVESYIATLTGAVDPEELVDRYRVALEQLVQAKAAGLTVPQPPASEPAAEAVDLMEALRRSVEEARRSRAATGKATKPGKAAAQQATPKKTATKRVARIPGQEEAAAQQATPRKTATKRVARIPGQEAAAAQQATPKKTATKRVARIPGQDTPATKATPKRAAKRPVR